jgi:glucan phosphoethanolaminetransferase (alkaline phosphatase superfamily)
MKKQQTAPVSKTVMEQIKKGDVRMRPRLYFVLAMLASLAAIVFSTLTLTYVLSILFFWFKIETSGTMAWGARANLGEALAAFPWWAVVLAVVTFALTVFLVKKQGRLYRYPTTLIVLVLALVSLITASVISYTNLLDLRSSPRAPGASQQQRGPGWQRNNF